MQLETKYYIPAPRPDLVPRSHLIRRLEDGLNSKLMLISAPAGYGKTTLLSEWAAQNNTPVAWLSLDENDSDLQQFLTYLIGALQTIDPDIGLAAEDLLRSSANLQPEQVITTLVNDLSKVENPITLVLDDYHLISEQSVHDALSFLIEHQPPTLHLFVATRMDPPFPLPRLRVRAQMVEIRISDLRFSPDETIRFLNEVNRLELPQDMLDTLAARTEGWAAGLQLAALSLRGQDDPAGFVRSLDGTDEYIADYLTDEILALQTEQTRSFLLQTSILERSSGPLCAAVTGVTDSQTLLEALYGANLFVVPLDNERRWFRYHHLFGDLLRFRLEREQAELIPELHLRASRWFEENGFLQDSITHAFAAGNQLRAAELMERHTPELLKSPQQPKLIRWLKALPEDLVRRSAWLCVFMAWYTYWVGQRDETNTHIRLAQDALANHPADDPERITIEKYLAIVQAFQAIQDEDIDAIFEMTQKAAGSFPTERRTDTARLQALGVAYWGCGNLVEAEKTFKAGKLTALRHGPRHRALICGYYEAKQQIMQGRLLQAASTLREALEIAPLGKDQEMHAAGAAYICLGKLALEWNRLTEAEDRLLKGLDMCTKAGYVDVMTEGNILLAHCCIARDDLDRARSYLSKAKEVALTLHVDPFVQTWLDEGQIRLWLAEGDLSAAIDWAEGCRIDPDGPLSYLRDLNHLNLAQVWVAQIKRKPDEPLPEQTHRLLDRLQEAASEAGWIHKLIQILLLRALVYQAAGQLDEALQSLSTALGLAEPSGYIRTFVDEGEPMANLLRAAAVRELFPGYVLKLLEALDDGSSPQREQPILDPLSERELEVLQLIADGLTNQEIADRLFLTVGTVKWHTGNIYSKLAVGNRMQAAAKARSLGLIDA